MKNLGTFYVKLMNGYVNELTHGALNIKWHDIDKDGIHYRLFYADGIIGYIHYLHRHSTHLMLLEKTKLTHKEVSELSEIMEYLEEHYQNTCV
jgi:hypothetical protein